MGLNYLFECSHLERKHSNVVEIKWWERLACKLGCNDILGFFLSKWLHPCTSTQLFLLSTRNWEVQEAKKFLQRWMLPVLPINSNFFTHSSLPVAVGYMRRDRCLLPFATPKAKLKVTAEYKWLHADQRISSAWQIGCRLITWEKTRGCFKL